jgi:hypothetical protein
MCNLNTSEANYKVCRNKEEKTTKYTPINIKIRQFIR